MRATLLSLHLMRYGARDAARAVVTERRRRTELASTPGLLGARPVLLTGLVPSPPERLGLFCAWEGAAALEAFEAESRVLAALLAPARGVERLRLQPVRVSGTWRGVTVATQDAPALGPDEPLLALVHARLRPRHAARFHATNLRVARAARRAPGYLGGFGLAESSRRFGSLSSWASTSAMRAYAYAPGTHRPVVRPARETPWSEDWFVARLRKLGPDALPV